MRPDARYYAIGRAWSALAAANNFNYGSARAASLRRSGRDYGRRRNALDQEKDLRFRMDPRRVRPKIIRF
ncbi:hypothetical protein CR492_13615 [Methylocella silvestris]|uniref:Uncharacterized protein n=1 Tax=Methylocella silvestris TaxID=199596 RepID=A0A2J7TF13_METSI|nr:hypothetical protein CR492_13615 [Methylocella silvestris]